MSVLKIEENDILWKFYKRSYELEGFEKPPHPVNLCNYFWSSVFGAMQCFVMEGSLWLVWVLSLVVSALGFGGMVGLVASSDPPSIWAIFLMLPCMVMAVGGLVIPFVALAHQLKGWALKIYQGLGWTVGGLAIVGLIWMMVYISMLEVGKLGFWAWLTNVGIFLGMAVGVGVGFITVLALLIVGITYLFGSAGQWKFLQTIWAYLVAIKHQMCPLIEPPPSYFEKEAA